MLPKQNRLKKRKDFEKVFKQGRGFKEDFLFLKVIENNLEVSRFGFLVSQKVSKKAVVRNKIKRRLRELLKTKLPEIKKGIDGVLIALPGLEDRDFWELEKILTKLLEKAGIFMRKQQF